MKKVLFNGVLFDDVLFETDGGVWSQICGVCVEDKGVDKKYLDNAGSGICGVQGCSCEANYYIDFNRNEIEFME